MDRYVDASGQVAGRLASSSAKHLLKGDRVFIVNAESAVITGDRVFTENLFKEKVEKGDPYHGPFYPKEPDMIIRRMIRCMLPFHTARGREAFRNLRVYKSLPSELKGKSIERPPRRKLGAKKIEVGELSIRLGVKKTW
jgi:large subunit ribosomal protein L13